MQGPRLVCNAARIGQQWAGIPGVEVTPGGRLYVAFFSGGPREPHPENTIYMTVSADGGETFAAAKVLAEPRGGARAFDPTLWLAPTGDLWLIFNRGNKKAGEHGVYARVCQEPDAGTSVFGEEFRVGYDVPFSFRINKPTVLSSGEWVMPVTYAGEPVHDWFAGDAQRQGVGISHDEGLTWALYGGVEAPEWALENMVVEREDGTLVMYIRTGAGVLWRGLSRDGGLSWSTGEPTGITNPGSRFFIRRLPGGDWLLINSPHSKERTGIVACLSKDEGESWRGRLVLDERQKVSYPDAARAPDGTIYAVHDRDRYGAAEILLTVFRKKDIRRSSA